MVRTPPAQLPQAVVHVCKGQHALGIRETKTFMAAHQGWKGRLQTARREPHADGSKTEDKASVPTSTSLNAAVKDLKEEEM